MHNSRPADEELAAEQPLSASTPLSHTEGVWYSLGGNADAVSALPVSTSPLNSFTELPSMSLATHARDPPRPDDDHGYNPDSVLDIMLPRGRLYKIIEMYFDYIHPLTPLLHSTTFWRDLERRRELDWGQEEWTALVLSVVALTICQLPYTFIPMTRDDARGLVQRCNAHIRTSQAIEWEKWSIERAMTTLM